ncbi:MAG: hypothetical protein AAF334_05835 [Pseudomonadota bacterium]
MGDDEKKELDDTALDAVQGGGRGLADLSGLGDIRATQTGFSVPGSNLMEGGEEEELQTRPSPDMASKLGMMGPKGPRGPGIK